MSNRESCRWLPSFLAAVILLVSNGGSLAYGTEPQPENSRAQAESLLAQAKAVLAPLDGRLAVDGLREPVEVRRDRWGIAHIEARNQHDLFFSQGFVAAQDRLFQLDLWRRVGAGETAELFGPDAVEGDRFARLVRYRGDMNAEWQSYSADTQEIATAFTNGINAWIDQCGDKLPVEFQILKFRPRKWRPEDVLGRMSGLIMSGNWQRELSRARLIALVGVEQARRLAPTDPPRDFGLVPPLSADMFPAEIARGYTLAARQPVFQPPVFQAPVSESNNWVVDGTLSKSGRPLLAGDPHRTITLPSLRYLVHLKAPGWNVIGAGEPALPGVAIGHNEHVAWAFTIVNTDQADLFVEQTEPDNPLRYRHGDEWLAMTSVVESIAVRGRPEPVRVELRFTRHGPVIFQDDAKRIAIALSWTGLEPGGAAYLPSLALDRAKSADEFLRELRRWKLPCLNFAYADVAGRIGWVAAALTPLRDGFDGLLPVPGWTGQQRWRGFLPFEELPQRHQPAEHWLATANQNILPPGYAREIAYDWEPPFRYERIRERLTSARDKFTVADFQSIQHEQTSVAARGLIAMLRDVDVPAESQPHKKLLTDWNGELSRHSPAAALYSVWLQELERGFFNSRIPADPQLERGNLRKLSLMIGQLTAPTESWFGPNPRAARDRFVGDALRTAVERTSKSLGIEPTTWQWGKLHTVTFRHPLEKLGPAYAKTFNIGPFPRGGDVTTPNNTRYDDSFQQIHGASYRQVFDLADWDLGMVTSAPGQSGQLGSPHYDDLAPLWAEERYFPLVFSADKVAAETKHRLVLTPR